MKKIIASVRCGQAIVDEHQRWIDRKQVLWSRDGVLKGKFIIPSGENHLVSVGKLPNYGVPAVISDRKHWL
ncbi:hypothetical protein NDU88_008531 [Pleurodeles waltl]|uniref:Uncharacterized protein n=1 Tax=Pleurodeles waltl TaxID=8319 RepID=A0AAV7RTI0_PLEWA|nr:hypothetical protein NDU88_008531 [Pleurodeles waltl]